MSERSLWLVQVRHSAGDDTSTHESFYDARDEFEKQKDYYRDLDEADLTCPVLIFMASVFESFEIKRPESC